MTTFHRRSIRLYGYDYASPGVYFVTMCTAQREQRFAYIEDDRLVLTEEGHLVHEAWYRSVDHRPLLSLDSFIVMPDHVHVIICFLNRPPPRHASGAGVAPRISLATPELSSASLRSSRGSLGTFVGAFKSAATRAINRHRQSPGSIVWQRNYFERVIRNDRALTAARAYIVDNPKRWIARHQPHTQQHP